MFDATGRITQMVSQDGTSDYGYDSKSQLTSATHSYYKYDSFGNVTFGDTAKTRYLFTSREFDTATDLQYNRARYCDAAVGRWVSEDPLGFRAGDANVGRYVGNGLTGNIDPSGFEEGH